MAERLVPIAVSSQLDVTGEERIHAAPYRTVTRATYVPGPEEPSEDVYFAYLLGNLDNTAPDYQKVTLGYGTVNTDGEMQILDTLLLDADVAQVLNVTNYSTLSGAGAYLYATLAGSTSNATGSIYVIGWNGAVLSVETKFKRVVASNNVKYRCVSYADNLVWAIEYRQLSSSPFTVSIRLLALQPSGNTFVEQGEFTVPSNTEFVVNHNGYGIIYDRSDFRLKAYETDGATITLAAQSAVISGYDSGSLDGQLGGNAIQSDGTHIYLYTNGDNVDTIWTFDGATFTEVWRNAETIDQARGAAFANNLLVRKETTSGPDEASLKIYRFDGAAMTPIDLTIRATELMGVAVDPQFGIILSPTYPDTNTSGVQVNGFSGIYQVDELDVLTEITADFEVVEDTPHTSNDSRCTISVIPELTV